MYHVFDIRGINGTGKSTLVRKLLEDYNNRLVLDEDIPYHYIQDLNLCVLGRYDKKGSGVDNIKGSDRLQEFMTDKLQEHNVLLEGVIVSHIFDRWDKMAAQEDKWSYHFLYIDIPIEVAIERIKARRVSRGKDPDYNEDNTYKIHSEISRTIRKLKANNRDITRITSVDLNKCINKFYKWLITPILYDMETAGEHKLIDIRGCYGSGLDKLYHKFLKEYDFARLDETPVPVWIDSKNKLAVLDMEYIDKSKINSRIICHTTALLLNTYDVIVISYRTSVLKGMLEVADVNGYSNYYMYMIRVIDFDYCSVDSGKPVEKIRKHHDKIMKANEVYMRREVGAMCILNGTVLSFYNRIKNLLTNEQY